MKDQVTQKPNPKRGKDTAVLAKFLTVIGKEYSKRADISLSGASNFKDSQFKSTAGAGKIVSK